jgi:4-hydroxybenzoate polyprenyltransferase
MYNAWDIERTRKQAENEAWGVFIIALVIGVIIAMSGIPFLNSIAVLLLILAVPIGVWYVSKKGTEAVERLMGQRK